MTYSSSIQSGAAATQSAPTGVPFLKWAGSKRRLLPQLLPLLPSGNRLIEPFVGSGSVFMSTEFEHYLLSDTNPVLMALYAQLQTHPQGLIAQSQSLFTEANRNQQAYNALRARFNDPATPLSEQGALFVYLNKFCFNGLYRINKKGQMNAPYGHPQVLPGFPRAAMARFANKLGQAQLQCTDFVETMAQAQSGDVVYCDPPYLPLEHGRGSFTAYDAQGFGLAEHERLALLAGDLARKGIPVVISNHDSALTRQLYAGASVHTVNVQRSMAASGCARGQVAELIAVYGA
jgi:DNA adenine methylase